MLGNVRFKALFVFVTRYMDKSLVEAKENLVALQSSGHIHAGLDIGSVSFADDVEKQTDTWTCGIREIRVCDVR